MTRGTANSSQRTAESSASMTRTSLALLPTRPNPAYAGTPVISLTAGTISVSILARRTAPTSPTRLDPIIGSPASKRTTTVPALAASMAGLIRSAAGPAASGLTTSMRSAATNASAIGTATSSASTYPASPNMRAPRWAIKSGSPGPAATKAMHGVPSVFFSDAFVTTGTSATSSTVDIAGRLAFFFAGAFLAGAVLAGAFFTGSFFSDFSGFLDAFFAGAFLAL